MSATNDWDPETKRRIAWLKSFTGTLPPFRLNSNESVVEPARFIQGLLGAIALGPEGPTARNGSLQERLRRIEEVVKEHQA